MDFRYTTYCRPNSVFYEPRATGSKSTLIAADSRPTSWRWGVSGGWEIWTPPNGRIRFQGWKIHLSAMPQNASVTLRAVIDVCIARQVTFKFLPTLEDLVRSNAKDANRAGSGKFVTIYPDDDLQLDEIAKEIHVKIGDLPAPYILSDVRMGDSSIFFRYGGFVRAALPGPLDEQINARLSPAGHLIPDDRVPYFVEPEGIFVPPIVRAAIAAYESTSEVSPLDEYESLTPVHFSNSGGVYRAQSKSGGLSILKEARPNAGLDFRGRDAVARLKMEATALQKLATTGIAPGYVRHFPVWEHQFLEMEHLDGSPLNEWVANNYPFNRRIFTTNQVNEYTHAASAIIRSMERALRECHKKDMVIGDIHPGNIFVMDGYDVKLIDLEDGRGLDDPSPSSMNVIGYAAPDGYSPAEADWFGMARTAASIFIVNFAVEILAPAFWAKALAWIEAQFGEEATDPIKRLLAALDKSSFGPLQLRPVEKVDVWGSSWLGGNDISSAMSDAIDGIVAARAARPARILFPGDIAQWEKAGALNAISGAGGVLLSLFRAGASIHQPDLDWLEISIAASTDLPPGLFDGTAGIACILHELGRTESAFDLMRAASRDATYLRRNDLYGGLAGVALAQLSFAQSTGNHEFLSHAQDLAETIRARLFTDDNEDVRTISSRGGLFYGWSGPSMLFAALSRTNGSTEYADLAQLCLSRDFELTVQTGDGSLGVLDTEGNRSFPYLAWGSAGIAVALQSLRELPGHSGDFSQHDAGIFDACSSEVYAFSGLSSGRAGIAAALGVLGRSSVLHRDEAMRQLRAINDLALDWRGTLQFPGDNYLRLSTDVGTGTAGILCALLAVRDGSVPWIPILNPETHIFGEVKLAE